MQFIAGKIVIKKLISDFHLECLIPTLSISFYAILNKNIPCIDNFALPKYNYSVKDVMSLLSHGYTIGINIKPPSPTRDCATGMCAMKIDTRNV